MGIFGDDRTDEIEALQRQIATGEVKRKELAKALATERKSTEALRIELGKAQAVLTAAKRAVTKARDRQKASVERANRLKAKLGSDSSQETGS